MRIYFYLINGSFLHFFYFVPLTHSISIVSHKFDLSIYKKSEVLSVSPDARRFRQLQVKVVPATFFAESKFFYR